MTGLRAALLLALSGVAAALIFVAPAGAHGNWFATAVKAGYDIDRANYANIQEARCYAPDAEVWSRVSGVRYQYSQGFRMWNHFACRLVTRNGDACWVVMHSTGKKWWQFTLSRYPAPDGVSCSPYGIGRRLY
ncbi:MAG: hypothetical protein WKF65_02095 [Gaiellaceae bacterium]